MTFCLDWFVQTFCKSPRRGFIKNMATPSCPGFTSSPSLVVFSSWGLYSSQFHIFPTCLFLYTVRINLFQRKQKKTTFFLLVKKYKNNRDPASKLKPLIYNWSDTSVDVSAPRLITSSPTPDNGQYTVASTEKTFIYSLWSTYNSSPIFSIVWGTRGKHLRRTNPLVWTLTEMQTESTLACDTLTFIEMSEVWNTSGSESEKEKWETWLH